MACILAKGHLLIEDVPGVGKTTLSHALARLLGLDYQRIQFTSDLLPADVIGVSIFDRESSSFRFHAGPIFAQIILADEINRASPKAQSALLEAMEGAPGHRPKAKRGRCPSPSSSSRRRTRCTRWGPSRFRVAARPASSCASTSDTPTRRPSASC
jgi:hypothetical protein